MNTIVKRNNAIPSIFGWNFMDKLFDELDGQFFENVSVYPTDVIELTDEKGNVTGYELDVTLAGIPRENVEVLIDRDVLDISVKKVEQENKNGRNYIRKGISQRSMQLRYGLHGIDKDKIQANIKDGMLKVTLPIAEEAKPNKIIIG